MQAKGLGIRLATPSPADADAARRVKYRSRHKGFRTGEKAKMAAITGESIFGPGKESSAQARRKEVLVKAAKLGIKTKGMRLLKSDESSATGHLRPSSGSSRHATPHQVTSTPRRKGALKRPRHAETGRASAHEDRCHGDGIGVGFGALTDDENAGVASLAVQGGDKEKSEVLSVPRKKRKRVSSSRALPTAAGAGAAGPGSNGGLAAIASLY